MDRQPEVRRAVALIGRWLIEAASADVATSERAPGSDPVAGIATVPVTDAAGPTQVSRVGGKSAPVAPVATADAPSGPAPVPPTVREQKVPLKIGSSTLLVDVRATDDEARAAMLAATSSPATTDAEDVRQGALGREEQSKPGWTQPDLELIVRRSRLKSRACAHALEMIAAGEGTPRRDAMLEQMKEMIAQAKSMNECFLWMFYKSRSTAAPEVIERSARCYDALADAAELACRVDAAEAVGPGVRSRSLQSLAQAQSALRVALQSTWLTASDRDQDDAYRWLAAAASRLGIRIDRYLRLDDPASPEDSPRLREWIGQMRSELDSARSRKRSIDEGLKRIRYHVRIIARSVQPGTFTRDLDIVERTLTELAGLGVARRDPTLDAVLMPLRDVLDGEMVSVRPELAGWFGASAADDRAEPAASCQTDATTTRNEGEPGADGDEQEGRTFSERVLRVRSMIGGRGIVIVGGQCREEAKRRIQRAFDALWVEWVSIREHASGAAMRAPIGRPDAAIVLIFIKLAGHLHVDEARDLAQRADIPAVSVTAGYNPEQLAHCILEQASERLRAVLPVQRTAAAARVASAAATAPSIAIAPPASVPQLLSSIVPVQDRTAHLARVDRELALDEAMSASASGPTPEVSVAAAEIASTQSPAASESDVPPEAPERTHKPRPAKSASKAKPARKKPTLARALAASITPSKHAPPEPVDRVIAGPRLFPGGAPARPIPDAPAVLSASLIDGPLAAVPASRIKHRAGANPAMKVLARAGTPTILGGG
jgi:hypothetical protein